MSDSAYCAKQANKVLKGAVILRAETKGEEFEDEQFNLIVKLPTGEIAEIGVSRDPEGNGPGWLDIGHLLPEGS